MKLKPIAIIAALVLLTAGAFFFIRFSNDHKECHEQVKYVKDAAGNMVEVKEHVCKERFSF